MWGYLRVESIFSKVTGKGGEGGAQADSEGEGHGRRKQFPDLEGGEASSVSVRQLIGAHPCLGRLYIASSVVLCTLWYHTYHIANV